MKFVATLFAALYVLFVIGVFGQCVSDSSDSGSISSSGCNDWSDSNSYSSSSDDDTSGRDGNKDSNKQGKALSAGEEGSNGEMAVVEQEVDAMKQELETTIMVVCAVAGLLIGVGIIGCVWYRHSQNKRKEVTFDHDHDDKQAFVSELEDIEVQSGMNGEVKA